MVIGTVIGAFISVLMGSVLYFVLQQLNSSGLRIPSNVNVFRYAHSLTLEGVEIIVIMVVVFISLLIPIISRNRDEDWD
jgi:cytochrome c biogenesis factor